jgi:hypothetical protein
MNFYGTLGFEGFLINGYRSKISNILAAAALP